MAIDERLYLSLIHAFLLKSVETIHIFLFFAIMHQQEAAKKTLVFRMYVRCMGCTHERNARKRLFA